MLRKLAPYLWIIPFLSFLGGYLLLSYYYRAKSIATPNLIGKPLDKALLLLNEYNLLVRVIEKREDSDLAEGIIVNQIPTAGQTIKTNQVMYVTITQKKGKPPIPNFCGTTKEYAQEIAHTYGLNLLLYSLETEAPENICLAQSPMPQTLSGDMPVRLYVAHYTQKPVIMPNFKGKTVDDVVSFLSLHDITPTILSASSNTQSDALVVDQRPLPGSLVTFNQSKPLSVQLQVA